MCTDKQFCLNCSKTWEKVSQDRNKFETKTREAEQKAHEIQCKTHELTSTTNILEEKLSYNQIQLGEAHRREAELQTDYNMLHQRYDQLGILINKLHESCPQKHLHCCSPTGMDELLRYYGNGED